MGEPIIHPSAALGARVVIAHDAVVGPNCYIDGETTIGARTRLVAGVTLFGNAAIGDDCVIEPGVTMTEPAPQTAAGPLVIGTGVRVGAGSVLARGVTIGANARIDARTIVSRSIPAGAIVRGNPGAVVGFTTPLSVNGANDRAHGILEGAQTTGCSVAGVKMYRFSRIQDLRGDPSLGQFRQVFPFEPKCYALAHDARSAEIWGEHAHRRCEQVLICVSGSVILVIDDGSAREEICLDSPSLGLYLPPRVWVGEHRYSRGAVMLVFASHNYDSRDYIRSYEQFIAECRPAA